MENTEDEFERDMWVQPTIFRPIPGFDFARKAENISPIASKEESKRAIAECRRVLQGGTRSRLRLLA